MSSELQEDRKTLWLMFYAQRSFQHAKEACDYILEHKLTKEDRLYYHLITSMVVNYGKLFSGSHGLGNRKFCISKFMSMIPAEFISVHEFLVNNRDMNFAHTDATVASKNKMKFIVGEDRIRRLYLCEATLKSSTKHFECASELFKELINETQKEIERIQVKHKDIIPNEPGEYPIIFDLPGSMFVVKSSD